MMINQGFSNVFLILLDLLVQYGVNKPSIANQRNTYAVFILTFDFRVAVLAISV